MENTFFDKTFRDDQGNLTIAQKPNLPILVWVSTALLQLLPLEAAMQSVLATISFGAIFTWAWLELFQGVNYFRRFLGLVVIVLVVAQHSM